MIGSTPLLLLVGAAALSVAAALYLGRERPVPGRGVALALRLLSLALVLLLLANPALPGDDPARSGTAPTRWVLLDGDLSLLLPDPEGSGILWEQALALVGEEVDRGARLALVVPGEGGIEGLDLASIGARGPTYPRGELGTALRALGAAGAESVHLLTTLRVPQSQLASLTEAASFPLQVTRLGESVRNAGVAAIELPQQGVAGEQLPISVTLWGEGGVPGDSLDLALLVPGAPPLVRRLPLPPPGTEIRESFWVELPGGEGLLRIRAEVALEGDPFPFDDARVALLRLDASRSPVLVLSVLPDWEPRTLLPVLAEVTGMAAEGVLLLPEANLFLPLESGAAPSRPLDAGEVRRRAEDARLLVLHGLGGGSPEWLSEVSASHPRVLHFPADSLGALPSGVILGSPLAVADEWLVESELPPSPLAPYLTGVVLGGLPPLGAVLPVRAPSGSLPGLRVGSLRTAGGAGVPALLFRELPSGERRVIAAASGFWRWGVREGSGREAYRALWGGVADWLLAGGGGRGGPELVQPLNRILPRGEPLAWRVAPDATGVELRLLRVEAEGVPMPLSFGGGTEGGAGVGQGEEVGRWRLDPGPNGIARTPGVDPGLYRFELIGPSAVTGAPASAAGERIGGGWVEVEGWAGSLRFPPLDPGESRALGGGVVGRSLTGRPLATHPLAYLLLLLLLSAEWLVRRKIGLR